ncbi:methyl-accepting chemotaxis protein, partial [Aureimonas endophytica]|uniref:methyl-accepting chemotaxis protein n=1 Tax=Aureimonas endophytica TaxID=2027858 RepID=UPI001662AC44
MLNKLGIRARITLGFVPLLLLMGFMAFNAVRGVDAISDLFASYRHTADYGLTISEMSDDLRVMRTSAFSFIADANPEAGDKLHASLTRMQAKGEALAAKVSDMPQLVSGLAEVRKDATDYGAAFDRLLDLQRRQDLLTTKLTEFGPWAGIALGDIMRSAWRQSNTDAANSAGAAMEPLGLSMMMAERFLRTRDAAHYDAAMAALSRALSNAKGLNASLRDELQLQRLKSALALLDNYGKRLTDAKDVVLAARDIQKNQLDQIGPRLEKSFEALQGGVVGRQKELGPVAEDLASSTSRSTIVIGFVLIGLGIALSYGIGRLISGSVRAMAAMMQRIADGDAGMEVQGAEHAHELGAMARSLRVFQETGRAKLQAEAESERARLSGEAERRRRDSEKAEEGERMAHAFEQLSVGLDALSRGDLTARVGQVDAQYAPIAEKFNASVAALEATIGSVVGSVGTIRM